MTYSYGDLMFLMHIAYNVSVLQSMWFTVICVCRVHVLPVLLKLVILLVEKHWVANGKRKRQCCYCRFLTLVQTVKSHVSEVSLDLSYP